MIRNGARGPASPEGLKLRMVFQLISLSLIALLLGGLYLGFAWNRYQQAVEAEALRLAGSIKALLHVEHIEALSPEDLDTAESLLVTQSLVHLVEATEPIYYAYILKQKDDGIVVAADSAAAQSITSKPIKRLCEETTEVNRLPFETGESILTERITTRCGSWVRALVPIYASGGGQVIAVLGLSYSAEEWQATLSRKMVPDLAVVLCLLTLAGAVFHLRHNHAKLKRLAKELSFQEALYRNVFEEAPIGIILQNYDATGAEAGYLKVNPVGETILGRTTEELKGISWSELTHAEDLALELPQFARFTRGEIHSYALEKRVIRPDGSLVWINFKLSDLSGSGPHDHMYLCLLEDISENKEFQEAIRESERSKSVFFSHLPGMAYRCKADANWTMEFLSEGCLTLTGYPPESLINNRDVSYNELVSPEYRDMLREEWEHVLKQKKRYHDEYEITTKTGQRKWVLELGQAVYDAEGRAEALEGIVLDISEQKRKEHQITYLRERDFLTGLYNRSHMEKEKLRLDRPEFWPLSVLICDIDGLRMINDAYGHEEGNALIAKTGELIEGRRSAPAVLGHVGGGEFILLLPRTDTRAACRLKEALQSTIARYNQGNRDARYDISVTIGYATKGGAEEKLSDVIKRAEEFLSNRKLLNQNSSHSAIVSSIMMTLYAKSQETEQHGQRLGEFCEMIGRQLGLEQKLLDDLQLFSKLHDIGKIGIDDQILNKPGKLNEEEWRIMKRHPEIGHRIAAATPQLEHIANYILYHHERWDGSGYPTGLGGEAVPLAARILSVADAFDAMTVDRIYQKAMPRKAALEEIERHSGSQFDPEIAAVFVALMRSEGE